jgi:hypothetical protein
MSSIISQADRTILRGRPFPPPRTAEELNDACFVVKDSKGQKLAYVYFEEHANVAECSLPLTFLTPKLA